MSVSSAVCSKQPFAAERAREDFPILAQTVNGKPLVYLDNAATTQKPRAVIDAISQYYLTTNANVHRGAHSLSDNATGQFEQARQNVAQFINSPKPEQVIWTRGTTESINLVAHSWSARNLKAGDQILVSPLEHHSNIVPWQLAAEKYGATIVPLKLNGLGEIDLDYFEQALSDRTVLLAVNHVSNALGTVNPVKKMVSMASEYGVTTLVDGAQSVGHFDVDVQDLGCDFFAFSGHKLFGPTGIGVLWGKESLLVDMPPYQSGGEMIETVSFDGTTFNGLPYKFEAGTPDIAGVLGLSAALDYLRQFERDELIAHEKTLLTYCIDRGQQCEGLNRIGLSVNNAGVFSFLLDQCHPADVGTLLDQQGIAVRTGHHCAQPLMNELAIGGTVRASFCFYNTLEDVDRLFEGIAKVKTFLL